jgi:EAL domain-containing protein (putative c-di-GMP-specific phosphodiesterase class I)
MLEGLTDTEVLAYADLAMYEAKETGRNRVSMYRPLTGKKERGSNRLVEAERIRHALEEDRLVLYCQPIFDLATNEICQYELLLRLPDGTRGDLMPPSGFLYAAERFGLIQAIDGWVVRKAIALIAEHERAGLKLVLNVNLSGKSIGDRKLAALIENELAETGIDPARLNFELTETAAIANVEEARAFASRLRGRGCQFSPDDFGAGFGSFYYLKNFPFDYLKIDGDFIRALATSPMDQLVVEAIVSIARGMGKKTVAEFVADEETACLLCKIGVDYAQGHHFGMPKPVADVLQPESGTPDGNDMQENRTEGAMRTTKKMTPSTKAKAPAPRAAKPIAPAVPMPAKSEIAIRAYELYANSGRQPGREVEFWLEAERQLQRGTSKK